MPLFPLDAVRNARPNRALEPLLQQVRDDLAAFTFPPELEITTEDALDAFDQARPRLNVIVDALRRYGGGRGIDVGTGLGFVSVAVARAGFQVIATEMCPPLAAFAARHDIEVLPHRVGEGRLPMTDMDFVVFSEVLEHVKAPPVAAIGEIVSSLRIGGLLVLTTPNVARLAHLEALLRGENFLEPFPEDVPPGADPTDFVEHVREYSVREVVEAVEANGLAIQQVLMTG
jgi:2-polyprenyl-3-methyl-5-hydroxy-6-metoxy-1,4-benzoquinol methylase